MIRPIVLRQHGVRNGSGAILARALSIPHSSPLTQRNTRHERYVINWGRTDAPNWRQRGLTISNSAEAVRTCSNKIACFDKLSFQDNPRGFREPVIPKLEWANPHDHPQEMDWVRDWLDKDGKIVVRKIVNGHSGAGIEIVRKGQEIPDAPLYTRYFKKSAEYRVHVAFGKVIHIQQKRRSRDANRDDNPDGALIRTNGNGWTFCINDLDCDSRNYRQSLESLALEAAKAVGIAHGAVDILTRHNRDNTVSSVVCEINSAPALRNPSTLAPWVGAFQSEFKRLGIRA